jgi:hypothetical protein
MTHDELPYIAIIEDLNKLIRKQMKAIDLVMELHKPFMGFTGGYDGEENKLWEEQCEECSGNGFSQIYPCPTIRAIQKELE